MAVRDTSKLALKLLDESGKGESLKAKILARLIEVYPDTRTRLELSKDTGITINSVTGKVYPLVREGAILEVGKRPCRVTDSLSWELRAIIDPQTEMF